MFLKENLAFKEVLSEYRTPLLLFSLKKILESSHNPKIVLQELKNHSNKRLHPLFDSFQKSFKKTKNLKISNEEELLEFFYEFIDFVSLLCFKENDNFNKILFKTELHKKCLNYCDDEKYACRFTAFCFKFLISNGILEFYKESGSNSHFLKVGANFVSILNLNFLNIEELLPGRDKQKKAIINKISKNKSSFVENSKKFDFISSIEKTEYAFNYEASIFLKEYLILLESSFKKVTRPLFEFDKDREDIAQTTNKGKFKLKDDLNKKNYKKYLEDSVKYNEYLKQVNDIVAIHNACYVGDILKLLGESRFTLNRRIDSRGRMYSTGILSFEVGSVTRLLILSPNFDYIAKNSDNYERYKKYFYENTKIKEQDLVEFYKIYKNSKIEFFHKYYTSTYFKEDK